MEMCYDGALVMPSNYAVMDSEEMTYVEGGGKFYDACMWILTQAVGGIIGGTSFAAVCAVVAKRQAIKAAVTSAVATIPWSRAAAVAILAGVVGVTAYVLTH